MSRTQLNNIVITVITTTRITSTTLTTNKNIYWVFAMYVHRGVGGSNLRSCHHLKLFCKRLVIFLDLEGRVEINGFRDTRF